VILPAGPACPAWVGPTVAIRVPALAPLRDLIESLGEPVVSTSVNRTGGSAMDDPHDIRREMGNEVDLVVSGLAPDHAASTLVDLTGKAPRLVRRGSYAWAAVRDGNPSK
jgi:tRNA A37 threonylcarbamoyladenosine synthetase subunit TsaC/SUA5/YrdC